MQGFLASFSNKNFTAHGELIREWLTGFIQSFFVNFYLFFDSTNQELRFTVAGPPGSDSKTTVLISGSLLRGGDDALKCCMKVFVDDRQVASSSTDAGITFEYVHSGRSEVVITTT